MDPVGHDQNQPLRPKSYKLIRFIICFIIIVVATISAFKIWKSHLENPSTAAQIACSVTLDHHLCFNSISSLQKNTSNCSSTANPSKIFALSLQVSINELSKMSPFLEKLISKAKWEWTVKALRNCQDGFYDSISILNISLVLVGDYPNENFLRETNVSSYLTEKIRNAGENIDKCRSGLFLTELYDEKKNGNEIEMKIENAYSYVDNSLRILKHIDQIHEKLNPTIGNIIDCHYLTATLGLGFAPYIFLAVLIILVVKNMY
ncbi:hypothetical protein M9H77_04946 [Catharanthus roseus]|uniref:Uncharacterized protein n=1 Tax=Catharanthus roseus TaxID=4058 RepID=A0ACC0CFX5_CATRO|nr:hypothetical protein M9H77_04946 [Catharanthus roseus]